MEEVYSFLRNGATYYYIAGVICLTFLLALFLRKRLSFLEKLRRKRLSKEQEDDFLSLRLDKKKAKQQRINSLEKRFTITRRAIYLLVFFFGAFFASIPFLAKVSSVYVSITVACVSVIFGIAAKPFIENMICGLVLCFGKLARIGDVVLVDNEYGVIEDVTLTHCIVRRWDWLRYVVPNSSMMTKEFVNYSLRDNYRWVHVEFFVDYNADIAAVEEIAKSSPENSEYYSGEEEPRFWITEMDKESIKCMAVAWATSAADGWMLSIDMRKNILSRFQERGIKTHMQNIALKEKISNKG